MEHLSSNVEQQNQDQQIQWRRDKVQELCSKGYSKREISQTLQVGLATVNRDISYLRNQPKIISKDTLMKGFRKNRTKLAINVSICGNSILSLI